MRLRALGGGGREMHASFLGFNHDDRVVNQQLCAAKTSSQYPSNHVRRQLAQISAICAVNPLNFVTLLLEVPLVRLFERAICFQYLQSVGRTSDALTDVSESECKIPKVQSPLTTAIGVKMLCDAVSGA
jgi:hypothetical protein